MKIRLAILIIPFQFLDTPERLSLYRFVHLPLLELSLLLYLQNFTLNNTQVTVYYSLYIFNTLFEQFQILLDILLCNFAYVAQFLESLSRFRFFIMTASILGEYLLLMLLIPEVKESAEIVQLVNSSVIELFEIVNVQFLVDVVA